MFSAINKFLIPLTCLVMLGACSDSDNESDGNPMNGGEGAPPAISQVSWSQVAGCTPGSASDVNITVTVADPDNNVDELDFSGSVSSCSGSLNGPVSVVSCPQTGTYFGNLTVTDPDGNSDSVNFSFGPCEDGQVTN